MSKKKKRKTKKIIPIGKRERKHLIKHGLSIIPLDKPHLRSYYTDGYLYNLPHKTRAEIALRVNAKYLYDYYVWCAGWQAKDKRYKWLPKGYCYAVSTFVQDKSGWGNSRYEAAKKQLVEMALVKNTTVLVKKRKMDCVQLFYVNGATTPVTGVPPHPRYRGTISNNTYSSKKAVAVDSKQPKVIKRKHRQAAKQLHDEYKECNKPKNAKQLTKWAESFCLLEHKYSWDIIAKVLTWYCESWVKYGYEEYTAKQFRLDFDSIAEDCNITNII